MERTFSFPTTWGADLNQDGSARFRLWAPSTRNLGLCLDGRNVIAMTREDNGWFACEIGGLRAGLPYSFLLDDGREVPDPAARAQAGDVHGASLLVDPRSHVWKTAEWQGRPWEEAVIYELHVGTFSSEGTFAGVTRRLDHIAELGFTAIELMPIAQFSGCRGWGYDGVLPYCPHNVYGGVDGLKRLVDAAHERELMVLLDVVYNHFGPDGNYIASYAPEFFDEERHTPWGAAIHFDDPSVRAFFTENSLYWLEEYRLDGLRFDAIDQISDISETHLLEEIAQLARARFPERQIHLTTEDERNIVFLHPYDSDGRPRLYTAEWNDDFHHAVHCIGTGESAGYYSAFIDDPIGHLIRTLAEGFAFQGEPYAPWENRARGVPSAGQPPTAFVAFNQNHDQIGNRVFGERLSVLTDTVTLKLLTTILLLSPQVPLMFMGEEWGECRPFLYFTDFRGDLAAGVRNGRRREFADFAPHHGDATAEQIPDPNATETFEASRLDWESMNSVRGREHMALLRRLLAARHRHIVPLLSPAKPLDAEAHRLADGAFTVTWRLAGGNTLRMSASFADQDIDCAPMRADGTIIHESGPHAAQKLCEGRLPAKSAVVGTAPAQVARNG
jgi:maltooligosyltrehalose trehalohydrolase